MSSELNFPFKNQVVVVTANGTYTPPSDASYVHIELWGGGAAGGNASNGGGFAGQRVTSILPLASGNISISLGNGGAGVSGNGGTSTLTYSGKTITAIGGSGFFPALVAPLAGSLVVSGGYADMSKGNVNVTAGNSIYYAGNGTPNNYATDGSTTVGYGGQAGYGNGGNGGTDGGAPGLPGGFGAGGGSGTGSGGNGPGAGGQGICILTYIFN